METETKKICLNCYVEKYGVLLCIDPASTYVCKKCLEENVDRLQCWKEIYGTDNVCIRCKTKIPVWGDEDENYFCKECLVLERARLLKQLQENANIKK